MTSLVATPASRQASYRGTPEERSRLPGFHKYSVSERLRLLYEKELLSESDYHMLMDERHVLSAADADKLVENVIGVFSLPLGVGLNFVINGRPYIIPLAVEEPSIIAALSSAAKTIGASGGFRVESTQPLLIGQVQVVDVHHPSTVRNQILQNKRAILDLANSLHPKMVARGGGARDVEVMIHPSASQRGDMVVVHLIVDTRDAMGANLVNSMCEGVAPLIEKITGGKVFLRILSNLTDRAMVCATCVVPVEALAGKGHRGEDVRDSIILAADFAAVDPYRAATHNKGIMNGIDAVAIATGNDWRAIEAAAHAWAGRGQSYTSLTKWYKNDGALVGVLEMPLKVGVVGGPMQSNPAVRIAHKLIRVESARQLAEVMGAVGLAQNFGALRALSTEGIQRGHMTLHARSVAVAAGATPKKFDVVVEKLMESGEIKVWKAQEILQRLDDSECADHAASEESGIEVSESHAAGHAKVILLGEHAVVYGSHAIAAPIPLAIQARVEAAPGEGTKLVIPRWGVEECLPKGEPNNSIQKSLDLIMRELGVRGRDMRVEVFPHVPRAMGFGTSAALAVAVIRAIGRHCEIDVSDAEVNRIAFACESIAHGTASGIDNTMATYGQFILFKKGDPPQLKEIKVQKPLPIVIGISGVESLTAKMVSKVRRAWERNPGLYDGIFEAIDRLTLESVRAIEDYDLEHLGEFMNVCQGLLNGLQVSSWEIEELIQLARQNGALGAKLTGGGGGGSMIALCPEDRSVGARIADGMRRAGYRAIITEIG